MIHAAAPDHSSARELLDEGDCKRVLVAWPLPEITAYAIYRAEARGAARIRVALEALAEGMKELQARPARE